MNQICALTTPENRRSRADQIGGYTRVRRTEGLMRSVIGAVVRGTGRCETPS